MNDLYELVPTEPDPSTELMPFITPCSFQIRKTSPMVTQRAYIWFSSTSNFSLTILTVCPL